MTIILSIIMLALIVYLVRDTKAQCVHPFYVIKMSGEGQDVEFRCSKCNAIMSKKGFIEKGRWK